MLVYTWINAYASSAMRCCMGVAYLVNQYLCQAVVCQRCVFQVCALPVQLAGTINVPLRVLYACQRAQRLRVCALVDCI